MNKLTTEKRAAILSAVVEGMSVNSVARTNQCSKVTVLRLLADARAMCARWHDEHFKGLQSERIQVDEAWGFIGCRDWAKKFGAQGHGSI